MGSTEIGGVIRTIIAVVGGALLAKGGFDPESAATITGAVASIAVAVWSWYQKRKSAKALAEAKAAPAETVAS